MKKHKHVYGLDRYFLLERRKKSGIILKIYITKRSPENEMIKLRGLLYCVL
jgi:hypothetical protein